MADRTDEFYAVSDLVKNGYGVQLQVSNGNPTTPVWQSIAGIVELTPGDMSTEDLDRTHLRSPDAHKEHGAGMRDSGPFAGKGKWMPDDESHSNLGGGTGPFVTGGIVAMWRSRKVYDLRIVLFDGDPAALPTPIENTMWPFKGYISKFQPGAITPGQDIDFEFGVQPTQAYDAALP